ncbi:MAG TPA: ABC transporter substrate-binding protein [Candidatus Sulfomarinibacteraceae bacterium]|nr:ABC transporter substrate-binding protein [Candidatus Sulfomarinibacteraceae bacterium]
MKATFGRLGAGLVTASLIAAACGGGGGGTKTVNIAIHAWVGYEANAAVVGYLLEKELGYKVEKKTLAEDVTWPGFESGEIDVILENWGHPDLEKTYIEEKKVAFDAGLTGNIGIIGWYVPGWMVDEYPDITDWNSLNKYADLFKTSESGDKGQFLGTDPSYVQYDEALVTNLGLNFKVIFSGSETATVQAIKTADAEKKPLLMYWWDPHWIHAQVKLVQVKLPPYAEGCDADLEKIACDYPSYNLNKIMRTKFADENKDAATLIKNFKWTNEDQNLVSDYITNQGMTAAQAGEKWIKDNEAVWKAWMP